MSRRNPRVALVCDTAGDAARTNAVHCLALADEVVSRGLDAVLLCAPAADTWLAAQATARRLRMAAPGEDESDALRTLEEEDVDAVVYAGRPPTGVAHVPLSRPGRPTVAVVDGAGDRVVADLVVDPGEGAERRRLRARAGTVLAGPEHVLLRNDVLANRPIAAREHREVSQPHVAVMANGMAPAAAGAVAQLLAATDQPFRATFYADPRAIGHGLSAVAFGSDQTVDVRPEDWRLHDRVARADVVLAAAEPAVYEWLCMGSALGLVWLAEEQVDLYRGLMMRRVVTGLGSLDSVHEGDTQQTGKLTRLLTDPAERSRLSASGWSLVDGLGRARVVDVLLRLL